MSRKTVKDFIIAFDFDNTLTDGESEWPMVGQPRTEMIEVAQFLYQHGFQITIWTLRDICHPDSLGPCLQFLSDEGVKYDHFNKSPEYMVEHYGGRPQGDPRKIPADIYIDDRSVGGLPKPKDIVKEVIIRYYNKYKKGKFIKPNQELDSEFEEFIDAYVEKYLTYDLVKTRLKRFPKTEDES